MIIEINKRLDIFLADYLNISRAKAVEILKEDIVLINGAKQKPSYKLKQNDKIEYNKEKLEKFLNPSKVLAPYDFKLNIIYEDSYLIVINKPKGILSHPTKYENLKSISNALINHCGRENLSDIGGMDRLGIVHRLDKNTAGLMIAAKNNKIHENLSQQIKTKTLKRKYLALAEGIFDIKQGIINKPLVHYLKDDVRMIVAQNGLEAITNYKVIKEFNKPQNITLVELELTTGRTHQIRVHLASINHPILADSLYGRKSAIIKNIKTQEQLLQSYYISFIHPIKNEKMEFQLKEDEFSQDFIKVLNYLKRSNKNAD